ncbi:unnamed protein product [Linum trigynum]|uniref:Uncharacterized protein n=1 Tax=Linum trigynum TaxID=586398 RepID=A0AAV2CBE9_9ROSI
MQKPLPSVSEAVDDLLQHEQKLKGEGTGKRSQTVALAVNTDTQSTRRNQEKRYCVYCKKTNHTVDECWRKKRRDKEQAGGNKSSGSQSSTPRFAGSVSQGSSGDSHTEGSVSGDASGGSPVSVAILLLALLLRR